MKQLTEELFLDIDEYNLILYRRVIGKKGKTIGKERYVPIGYFANIYQVARRLTDEGIKLWIEKDFNELIKYYEDTYNRFVKAINELDADKRTLDKKGN